MSQEQIDEIHQLVQAATAVNKRWSLYKIAAWLVGCVALIFGLGLKTAAVYSWKESIDQFKAATSTRLDKLEGTVKPLSNTAGQLTQNVKNK